MTEQQDSMDARRRRAVYRAGHRGTKEMDWLLGKFAAAEVPSMSGKDLAAFERLLALPDLEIENWLLHGGQAPADTRIGAFVARLKAFHNLDVPGG